jgi:hypothetical protein
MNKFKKLGRMTPWGRAQVQKRWTDGIYEFETATHGGFYLQPEWNAVIPEALIAGSANAEQCRNGWYEEDVDWAIVVLSFPYIFGAKLARQAVVQLRNDNPNFNDYLDGNAEEICELTIFTLGLDEKFEEIFNN